MIYNEIYNLCRRGKIGLIPGWIGYIKYDYNLNQLYFVNGDYILKEDELKKQIGNRTDLLYII